MKKKAVLFAMTGVLAAGMLTGCSSWNGSAAAVKVGDTSISADAANFYARYTQAQYETYYAGYLGEDMWTSDAQEGKNYEEFVKESIQDELKKMIVLEEHMDEYEVTLTDEDKAIIDKAAAEFDEANTLDEKEKVSGDTKTVTRVLKLMAIQQKMTDAIQAGADTEVSDEEAAQKSMQYVYFAYTKTDEESGTSTDLTEDEKAAVKEKASAFAEGAQTAADLSAYATEQGQEAQTATFDSESTSPDKDLIKAVDALAEGGTSALVETDGGCYVARVTSLLDRAATDSKKESIVQERKSELYNDTCDKWIKDEGAKVDKKVWKKMDFNDMSVTIKQNEQAPYADEVQTDDAAE